MKPAAKTTPAGPHPEPLSRCARALDLLRRTCLCKSPGAVGLLAAGLLVTVLITLYVKSQMEADARRDFVFACHEVQLSLDARLAANAQVLRAGAALFSAGTVSREEWRSFTQELQLERQLPGIQGLGFAQLIPREQLPQHIQEIRREGFPDYQVTPAGERDTYSAIIYLEPFSERNLRAFGYDMLTEPVRRAAMERARDDANAVLSGKVILVQETDQDVQSGVLLYIPVYRHGLPIETIAQRRAAIQGWVYSPYRIAEEALTNAVKHAQASQVTVRLDPPQAGWLRLTVRDDGPGFDVASALRGLGMAAMQDYAEAAGGECGVHSVPGKGTVVTAILPLVRPDAAQREQELERKEAMDGDATRNLPLVP